MAPVALQVSVGVVPTAVAPLAGLADAGATLIINGHSESRMELAVAAYEKKGFKVHTAIFDVTDEKEVKRSIDKIEREIGPIDILVNNAAHQATFQDIGDISDEEWDLTFKVNIHAMFYLTKAAVPHMGPGSAIVNTASINSDMPNPILLAYATTKGAIQNFTGGLAQMLADKGIELGYELRVAAEGEVGLDPLLQSSQVQLREASDLALRERLGRAARERAVREYSWEAHCRALDGAMRRKVEGRRTKDESRRTKTEG